MLVPLLRPPLPATSNSLTNNWLSIQKIPGICRSSTGLERSRCGAQCNVGQQRRGLIRAHVPRGASFPGPAPSPNLRCQLCLSSDRSDLQHLEEKFKTPSSGCRPPTSLLGAGAGSTSAREAECQVLAPPLGGAFSWLPDLSLIPAFTIRPTSLAAHRSRKPKQSALVAGLRAEADYTTVFPPSALAEFPASIQQLQSPPLRRED
ncbi:hypothetical protein HJG60_010951 [Phyllostomus discolor]|uniref:Uncharacterized protein n=1 Tax=Phyllostomus discolor TaxID=89673 RepID=A0A834A7Y6_9CHIR|nr:hypothetical protein HJG60_010951 [Phyllostomus discolor]